MRSCADANGSGSVAQNPANHLFVLDAVLRGELCDQARRTVFRIEFGRRWRLRVVSSSFRMLVGNAANKRQCNRLSEFHVACSADGHGGPPWLKLDRLQFSRF